DTPSSELERTPEFDSKNGEKPAVSQGICSMYTIVILELTRVKREAWKRFSVCGQRFPAGQTVVRVWLALALVILGCGLRLAAADQGSPSQGVSAGKPAMTDTTAADREVAAFERNLTNRLRILTEAPG